MDPCSLALRLIRYKKENSLSNIWLQIQVVARQLFEYPLRLSFGAHLSSVFSKPTTAEAEFILKLSTKQRTPSKQVSQLYKKLGNLIQHNTEMKVR